MKCTLCICLKFRKISDVDFQSNNFFSGDFVYITDKAYTESQIREMEMKILQALAFDLGRPLPLHFLRRNSKAGNVDAMVHTLVRFSFQFS